MRKTLYRTLILVMAPALGVLAAAWAQAPSGVRYAQIRVEDMKVWLGYLAADELQGRQVFTEGYGRATQYIADNLKLWGVRPLGADGTYFQPVKLRGYRVSRNSSVTVEAAGQSRTFKHGDHVTFPIGVGGKQALSFSTVEFVRGVPADYQGREVKGKLIVLVPNRAPAAPRGAAPANPGARGGGAAGAIAAGAGGVITFTPTAPQPTAAEQALSQAQAALTQAQAAVTQANNAVVQAQQALRGGGQRGNAGGGPGAGARGANTPDFTTVLDVHGIVVPQLSGDETFFEALLADGPLRFSDVTARMDNGESALSVALPSKVTVTIDNGFEQISEQISHNVVGMVEGTDPVLKDTYVLFGAHLDHTGYSQTAAGRGGAPDACRRRSPAAQAAVTAAGRVVQRPTAARGGAGAAPAAPGAARGANAPPPVPFDQRDLVNNGADDNASGSTAILAVANAFATGPKPKRSVVFVWHTGEESGLYGSRYNADFPVVPLEKIQAAFNLDMVGRDDCNNIEGDYTNSVFIVGADRISTDLHNLIVQTNSTNVNPLTLDYELNDPNDPENVYTRSDHFSYAAKGIPIAFFTTGLHPDYHRASDTVEKITFPKMARIAQLVYQSGFSVANMDRALERDNKGARTGFGARPEVLLK